MTSIIMTTIIMTGMFDHVLVAAGEGWKTAEAVSPSLPSGSQGLAPGNIIEKDYIRNVRAHKKTNNNYKM